jgi:Zn-dependent M28 family amino/carboxypeptidase
VVFGKGKSTLEDLLAATARLQEREVTAESDVHAGWYYRSDQFSLARVGVPSIWFRSGTDFIGRPEGWGEERFAGWIRKHYHRPSDEVSADENSMDVMGSKSCKIKADRVFWWHTEITTFGFTQWTAPVLNGAFGEHHADPSQFRP